MVTYLASAICDWNRCKAPEKKKSWSNIVSKGKEKMCWETEVWKKMRREEIKGRDR